MAGTTTQAPPAPPEEPRPAPLGPVGMLRWSWRQLTSMRTALFLLFMLALAAIPGSLVPQRPVNPLKVADFARTHPTLAAWYDKLSLFDVFSAPWFAAIYLLLLTSLVGCVVPRARRHVSAMRARPPAAPRNLGRLPAATRWETDLPPDEALAATHGALRARRFRTVLGEATVSAEKGHLKETGNLLFHMAMLGFLLAVALGSFFGFKGTVLLVRGHGFANTVSQYDDFTPGRLYDASRLAPFVLTLDQFDATYQRSGQQRGAARSFDAHVTFQPGPGAGSRRYDLRVNHPLDVSGTKVFLTGHGYAPRFTVRDGTGHVVLRDAVPFLPQDGHFTSSGVVKVPDARPSQLGFQGLFLPTAPPFVDPRTGPRSLFPAADNPQVLLTGYRGDLGLDSGIPQSVYSLDATHLHQFRKGGQPLRKALTPGQTMRLPHGAGSITFDGVSPWVNLQVRRNPGNPVALGSAVAAVLGIIATLGIRRRRVWVRVSPGDGRRTVVEFGGLARSESAGFAEEFAELSTDLRGAAPEARPPASHQTAVSEEE